HMNKMTVELEEERKEEERKRRKRSRDQTCKSTDRVHRCRKKKKEIENEEEWKKVWDDIIEEVELEIKGGGKISKEQYFSLGLVLDKYPKEKKRLTQFRLKAARR